MLIKNVDFLKTQIRVALLISVLFNSLIIHIIKDDKKKSKVIYIFSS